MTFTKHCDIITLAVEKAARYGSIAQLGEHLPYKQRVIGSSPIVSTIFYNRGKSLGVGIWMRDTAYIPNEAR